jgi:periplasmic protein TonB
MTNRFSSTGRQLALFIASTAAATVFATGVMAQAPLGATPAEMAGFKRAVAQRIIQVDKPKTSKAGVKAVSVVGYTLDRAGSLTEQWIVRSSGDHALDERAMAILRKSAPLPKPPVGIFGNDQQTHLSEAWVFTNDGGYNLQTLVSR